MKFRSVAPRVELHTHLGSSVDPAVLWSLAHNHGIRLPSKDYWEFQDLITMRGAERNKNLDEMHNNFFYWTELIQSSPEPLQESVRSVIGGGYRASNIVLQELRFNPMFRNRGGEKDLDHIIMAGIWGLDKATLEYPQVKAGIILMMDRTLTYRQNEIIVEKAIRYKDSGVIGIDLGGPQRKNFSMKKHAALFMRARHAGLGLTVHTGEEGSLEELRFVIRKIRPERIGHGNLCVKDAALVREIVESGIVLETCPSSNIKNSIFKNYGELKKVIQMYLKHRIKFTVNTDGPEMYCTNIAKEQQLLIDHGILTRREVERCTRWAFEASFIKD